MHIRSGYRFIFAMAAVLLQPVQAQPSLKPGLWQMQMKMPGDPEFEKSMAEMRESLAAMSPQERQQMEAAMGKGGMQAAAGNQGGTATRFCLSREQADKQEVPASSGDCKVTRQSRAGGTYTTAFSCTNPRSSGESQVTFLGPGAYRMKTTLVTEEGGKKDKTVIEGDAQWLAADCGALRPRGAGK